jgi:hypothetical protein
MASKEEALEAAKLAAMVGGQLKMLDKMTTNRDNHNPFANKININEFVERVKNPNASSHAKVAKTPAGWAPPPPEDFVRSQVPDILPSLPTAITSPEMIPMPPATLPTAVAPSIPQQIGSVNFEPPIKQVQNIIDSGGLTRSDIDSIRNSLKGIDKSLSGLLNFFKNSKLV